MKVKKQVAASRKTKNPCPSDDLGWPCSFQFNDVDNPQIGTCRYGCGNKVSDSGSEMGLSAG